MADTARTNTKRTQSVARIPEAKKPVAGFRSSDTTLAGYFRSIGAHKTLDAEDEAAQAKNLFDLEQELWNAVISDRSLVPVVKQALTDALSPTNSPEIAGEVADLLDTLVRRKRATAAFLDNVSGKLRDLDEDRTLIAYMLEHLKSLRRNRNDRISEPMKRRMSRINRLAARVTQAKHGFIRENLGLVVNIAKRYHVDQMSLSDLIQEGNLGLMRAVDKFDYRKGFRFSTYASWWIRSYISRAIVRKSNTVRIPEYMLRDRNRIKRTDEAHKAKEGRGLNEEELASELGLSKKRLRRTLRHDVAFVESLDREMPGNDNQKYIDFLADEDGKSPLEMASFNDWLRSIPQTLEHLSVVERFVISWRFGLVDGDEMTLQEIGKCLSLSRERIRQIQEEALIKLRDRMEVTAA